METNELRIGNYVKYEGYECYREINEISKHCIKYHDPILMPNCEAPEKPVLVGIPLTKECVIKFGFEKITNDYISGDFEYSITDCLIDGNMEFVYVCSKDATLESKCQLPKYVHQLQNLYYALTKKELTIKK